MNSDFVFRMGATHHICQDYAAAGQATGVSYAILSDGCSGSPVAGEPGSPYTDFGARFMVRAAQRYVISAAAGDLPVDRVAIEAEGMARQARLPRASLDATLLVASATPSLVNVYQVGDGIVAARKRTGEVEFSSVSFGSNMPFYLSYALDPRARAEYIEKAKTWSESTHDADGASEITGELCAADMVRRRAYSCVTYDLVLLLSDGAESFQDAKGEAVPLALVLEQVFAIKGFAGQFLGRRCGKFLSNYCTQMGWKHADDFSAAGVYLGDAP